jgi:hypothetical protein
MNACRLCQAPLPPELHKGTKNYIYHLLFYFILPTFMFSIEIIGAASFFIFNTGYTNLLPGTFRLQAGQL